MAGELTIQPGTYDYQFDILLPVGVPTSLEAQNGHIRYGLQVVLDRPRWPDQKFEESFTVIKPLNLNSDFSLRVSSSYFTSIDRTRFPFARNWGENKKKSLT